MSNINELRAALAGLALQGLITNLGGEIVLFHAGMQSGSYDAAQWRAQYADTAVRLADSLIARLNQP
jgi:hypothetical protein